MFVLQLITFLTRPPGSWLYVLGLVVALEAPAALALQRWWASRGAPAQAGPPAPLGRTALAAGGLLALRAVLLLAVLLIPPGSRDARLVVPPLERAVTALGALLLIWALAFPRRSLPADLAAAALALAGVVALALAWVWWGQAVDLGLAFFNGTVDESAWVVATLALLVGGLWLVAVRREPGWRAGAALLAGLLIAEFAHYLYPLAGLDAPALVRWAELIVLPAAMLLLYRRAAAWPAPSEAAPDEASPARPPARPVSLPRQMAETLLVAAVVYFGIEFATGRFRVEGPSMQPNLYAGQYVLTDRLAYRLGGPQRGDVVVVQRPGAVPGQAAPDLIKRVVGLPGETVSVYNGVVSINGQVYDEPYILEAPDYTGIWNLGPDEYFVLGDNRTNSSDSHIWGPLPRAQITGKALLIYWPPSAWGLVPHY